MTEDVESEIVHRELDTAAENPAVEIAKIVADLEEKDHADLATMYDVADHVIDNLFSQPPAPEAQFQVSFSYEGYRITVEQNGALQLMKVGTE